MSRTTIFETFNPGAGNVEKALDIYDKMQSRNNGNLAVLVAYDYERLVICGDGRRESVGHAVGFIAECARRLNLTRYWSAEWSRDGLVGGVVALDLATQAFTHVHGACTFSLACQKLDCQVAQKERLKFEVAMRSNTSSPTEWLNENLGDDWRHYTKAVTVDDEKLVEEQVYLFKTANAAVEFKLRFG